MFFRTPRFIRRMIRKRTNQIPVNTAATTRQKISFAYAFIAWNGLGYISYLFYTGRFKKVDDADEENLSIGRYFAKLLKAKDVTLVTVKGFNIVSVVDLEEEERNRLASANKLEQDSESNTTVENNS